MSKAAPFSTAPVSAPHVDPADLLTLYARGQEALFDPFTGVELATGVHKKTGQARHHSPSQLVGLDAPRYCAQCGRRMTVQVLPTGWIANCSRHGELSSEVFEQH